MPGTHGCGLVARLEAAVAWHMHVRARRTSVKPAAVVLDCQLDCPCSQLRVACTCMPLVAAPPFAHSVIEIITSYQP